MSEVNTTPASEIDLIDESFDPKKSNSYHLSILVGGDPSPKGSNSKSEVGHFTFLILDRSTNKYLALKQTRALSDFSPLGDGGTWGSVTCAIAHPKFTLVPSALFDDENKNSLLGFNHPIANGEKTHSDSLRNLDARNLFTIDRELESSMRKQFPNIYFLHNATAFIEGLLVQNKNKTGKKVFANFSSSYFEVVILEGSELLFSNAFKYKTPEDIAYYILFVYEQLHLNPEEVELTLSGEIEKTAKEHTLLYNYIRHVKFAALPDSFKYSYKFDEVQEHRFFSLFNQYLVTK